MMKIFAIMGGSPMTKTMEPFSEIVDLRDQVIAGFDRNPVTNVG